MSNVQQYPLNVVIAPDSFKGCLSSVEAAMSMETGIHKAAPNARIRKVPMADGGEGTVEALVAAVGGVIRHVEATGPLGDQVRAFYGILQDGMTAVIEMAAASGLPLVPEERRNPLVATSYGTGELMRHAVEAGCRKLIIGIGGSATNDGGMGMMQALGVKFYDSTGAELEAGAGGGALERIAGIDMGGMLPDFAGGAVEIVVSCDVTNPLCGPRGASAVYGPQKGATPEMIERLDRGLAHYAEKIKQATGKSVADVPGAGAAGGMGGGLLGFLNAELKRGIDIVMEATRLEQHIREADIVFTGEGRTDGQTAFGKVPAGIAALASRYGKPVFCLSGGLSEDADVLCEQGVAALFSIADGPISLEDAMRRARTLLERSACNVMRVYAAGRRQ